MKSISFRKASLLLIVSIVLLTACRSKSNTKNPDVEGSDNDAITMEGIWEQTGNANLDMLEIIKKNDSFYMIYQSDTDKLVSISNNKFTLDKWKAVVDIDLENKKMILARSNGVKAKPYGLHEGATSFDYYRSFDDPSSFYRNGVKIQVKK